MTSRPWGRQRLIGLLAVLLPATASAVQPKITSPGSTWGEVIYPSSTQPDEHDNMLINGAVEQGVDFSSPEDPAAVTLFGKLDYSADTDELDYNNKLKLGVGVKFGYVFTDGASTHVGIKYEYDNRFTSGRDLHGSMLFADVYKGWVSAPSTDVKRLASFPLAYPGLTWGELRYPGSQDPSEEDDLIVEGAVEQGIDWFKRENVIFNTFAEVGYIVDSKKLDWNNELTLGAGIKLRFPLFERISTQIGVKYNHDRRWESGQSAQDIIWFISWSDAWSLPL